MPAATPEQRTAIAKEFGAKFLKGITDAHTLENFEKGLSAAVEAELYSSGLAAKVPGISPADVATGGAWRTICAELTEADWWDEVKEKAPKYMVKYALKVYNLTMTEGEARSALTAII